MGITKEMIESWLGKEIVDFQVVPEVEDNVLKIKVNVFPKQSTSEIKIIVTPRDSSTKE